VPDEILYPQKTWTNGGNYEEVARDLAGRFRKNFSQYEANVDKAILAASPK
jgi:phosphoenolpyruvate carboxykinase (ATP)